MYADDAAIFVLPIKEDIENLTHILRNFEEVTGLCTRFQKSLVAPIRCQNINLEKILQSFPATISGFPMQYLGLPLIIRRRKKVPFLVFRGQDCG